MIYDAHVHVGYYSRLGSRAPFYYSPRRVAGVLHRCGVEDFIVSSTCAQVTSISLADIMREAREMKRVAGGRAHQFFWLAGRFYVDDRNLSAGRICFVRTRLSGCPQGKSVFGWCAFKNRDVGEVGHHDMAAEEEPLAAA